MPNREYLIKCFRNRFVNSTMRGLFATAKFLYLGFEPLWYPVSIHPPDHLMFPLPNGHQINWHLEDSSGALYKYNHSALASITWQPPKRTQWNWAHNGILGGKSSGAVILISISSKLSLSSSRKTSDGSGGIGDIEVVLFAEVSTDDLSSRYGVDGRVEVRELIEDVLSSLPGPCVLLSFAWTWQMITILKPSIRNL